MIERIEEMPAAPWSPMWSGWPAMHMFAWMTPGDVMICDLDQLEDAKTWVAG